MKKKYVITRDHHKEIRESLRSTRLLEFVEDVPNEYVVKFTIEDDEEEYTCSFNKQSTFGTIEFTDKEKKKFEKRLLHLKLGVIALMDELKEAHDEEFHRMVRSEEPFSNIAVSSIAKKIIKKGEEELKGQNL